MKRVLTLGVVSTVATAVVATVQAVGPTAAVPAPAPAVAAPAPDVAPTPLPAPPPLPALPPLPAAPPLAAPGAAPVGAAVTPSAPTLQPVAYRRRRAARVPSKARTRSVRRSASRAPGASDPLDRARAALAASVPAAWVAAVPVRMKIIGGHTSMSSAGGLVRMSTGQVRGSWAHVRFIATHEWAHQLAFLYGSQAYFGAPPAGFPYRGVHPEELWADCVARALTGVSWPTYGLYPRCSADLAGWAAGWLAPGPAARSRTDH